MKVNDSIVDTRFYLLSRIFSSPPSHTLSQSEGLGLCFLIHLKQTNQLNGGGSRSHILPIFCPSHILKSSHHHRHRHQPQSQSVCPFISFGHRAPSCAIWVFVCSSLTPWLILSCSLSLTPTCLGTSLLFNHIIHDHESLRDMLCLSNHHQKQAKTDQTT